MKQIIFRAALWLATLGTIFAQSAPQTGDARWQQWNSVAWQNVAASTSTIATLKAQSVTFLATGTPVYVQGYYTAGDGGGGIFVYNSASSATANDGTIVQPTTGSGRWIRPASATFYTIQFGVKADNSTDNTSRINLCIAAALASPSVASTGAPIVEFMPGPTVISNADNAIVFTGPLIVHGNGAQLRVNSPVASRVSVRITGFSCYVHNLYVNCPTYSLASPISALNGTAIQLYNAQLCTLYSCYTNGFAKGFQFIGDAAGSSSNDSVSCISQNCSTGFEFTTTAAGGGACEDNKVFGGGVTYGAFSTMTGSRAVAILTVAHQNSGIVFFGSLLEGSPEYKVNCFGSRCAFMNCYWDNTNGGTDILLDSTSKYNIVNGGADLDLMVISDSGTSNTFLDPKNGFKTAFVRTIGDSTEIDTIRTNRSSSVTAGIGISHDQIQRYDGSGNPSPLSINPAGGATVFGAQVGLKGYTVATLPTGTIGQIVYVTDSSVSATAALGLIIVGGGSFVVPVYFDSTNWRGL